MGIFNSELENSIIIQIPHSSIDIPEFIIDTYNNSLLQKELFLSTDHLTDQIFNIQNVTTLKAPFSRLFCDMERFFIDEMDQYGRGFFTYKTQFGEFFREFSLDTKEMVYQQYFLSYQKTFSKIVENKISKYGMSIIIDAHSFNSVPLIFEKNQSRIRPDICIGTDEYHTPEFFKDFALNFFEKEGFSVAINNPYSGAIVPLDFYLKDKRVLTIMIEINKRLYMNEVTGEIFYNSVNFLNSKIRNFVKQIIEN
jgi:N-formylglutamate deformylase